MTTNNNPWNLLQKISFRFLFLFLGLTSFVCWDLNIYFCTSAFYPKSFDVTAIYKPLTGSFYWLDKHFYHSGYLPKIHESFPEDNHFGTVYYVTLFFIAIIIMVAWTILDKKRPDYRRLLHWFNLYLRIILGITLVSYGLVKLIPVQKRYPSAVDLTTPYGEQSLLTYSGILWEFRRVI